jgi:hypothetical protein
MIYYIKQKSFKQANVTGTGYAARQAQAEKCRSTINNFAAESKCLLTVDKKITNPNNMYVRKQTHLSDVL